MRLGRSKLPTRTSGSRRLELLDDVLAHPLASRSRCRRGRWPCGKRSFSSAELAVLRAEVVAPVADAVGLVDGEGADVEPLQQAPGTAASAAAPARRRAGGSRPATISRFGRRARSSVGDAAVQRRGGIAALAQAVDLVLHQRDQRRDDDVGALAPRRRDLVAQRLAAAGRQHDQRVAARQPARIASLLQRPQLVVAPVAAQGLEDVGICRICGCWLEFHTIIQNTRYVIESMR